MKVLLVAFQQTSSGPLKKLFRVATFPVLPRKGDDIEYEDGWGLSGIRAIYLSQSPTLPEIFLETSFEPDEVASLLATGHWSEDVPAEAKEPR